MTPFVHIDKNQEPDGRWLLTVVIELTEGQDETFKSTVVSQTNMHFDQEPQIQYRDWS